MLDITGRKLAEAELAAEATRRRVLIEGSRDGIVILDRDGRVFDADRRIAEMLGYSIDELRPMQVSDWDLAVVVAARAGPGTTEGCPR